MAMIQKTTLKDGTLRWKATVRRKGVPKRSRTFRTRAQAKGWAKRVEVEILDGRTPSSAEEERRTVDDLIEVYTQTVVTARTGRDRQRRHQQLEWWSSRLGGVRLIDLRRSMVADSLRALEHGASPSGRPLAPATCNRYLATLRHAFSYAMKELEWIPTNPLSRMLRTEPRGRVRFLSDDERSRLLEACKKSTLRNLYPLVLLAISTGARQTELLSLRWSDIDLDRQVAVLQHTKNGDRRALPLQGEALRVLQELRDRAGTDTDADHVFFGRKGPTLPQPFPTNAWKRALEKAEIEDLRFHDLRHTAASYLAMSGATLAEIAEILGHKTLAMVKRYAHLTDQHTSRVVARMNERYLSSP